MGKISLSKEKQILERSVDMVVEYVFMLFVYIQNTQRVETTIAIRSLGLCRIRYPNKTAGLELACH